MVIDTACHNKLVSVCIPTYNGGKYLLQTLESVQSQTYDDIEIIISDDNSSDNTLEVIKKFNEYTRFPIRLIQNKNNGIAQNWNNCLIHSNGEYIKFLFQDDLLKEDCIHKMLLAFELNPNVELIASKRSILVESTSNKNYVENWMKSFENLQKGMELSEEHFRINRDFLKSDIFLKSPINKVGEPSSYFFRKDLITRIGLFNEKFHQLLDYEFCLRILKLTNKEILILNEKLISFRLHNNQATNTNTKKSNETVLFKKMLFYRYFMLLGAVNRKMLFLDYTYTGKIFKKLSPFLKPLNNIFNS